jgi:hypothetical protein
MHKRGSKSENVTGCIKLGTKERVIQFHTEGVRTAYICYTVGFYSYIQYYTKHMIVICHIYGKPLNMSSHEIPSQNNNNNNNVYAYIITRRMKNTRHKCRNNIICINAT